jgi:MFS family permease
MLPYVVCSWWAARVGDRQRRDRVVRATVLGRLVLLAAVPAAVALDQIAAAVVLAALAVAVATPAYPTLAAAMPDAAREDSARATDLLVTIEVASFVVGPAFGGVLLGVPVLIAPLAIAGLLAALALLAGVRLAPAERRTSEQRGGTWAAVRASSPIRRSLVFLSLLNLVLAAVGVTLVLMARGTWTGWWTPDTAYGVASGALGFGALAAPSLARCGSTTWSRSRAGVLLLGAALAVVAVSPTVLWALLPLLLAGAAAVHAESAVTGVMQHEADDEVRASLFGVADACMVGAAMLGALAAPTVAAAAGPAVVLGALALLAGATTAVAARPGETVAQIAQLRPTTTVPPTSSSVSTTTASPADAKSSAVRSA